MNATRPDNSRDTLVLFGAAPDTLNHGVTALMASVADGLTARLPRMNLAVADHGAGLRQCEEGGSFSGPTQLVGMRQTRRWHLREAYGQIALCARLGGLGNPAARLLRNSRALLDISGGDSFTDLYGPWRFRSVMWPKRMARSLGKPLILLPQTYGPFRDAESRAEAATAVAYAEACWARDQRSFQVLCDLLGERFDAARHRLGVDVAFSLVPRRPPSSSCRDLAESWATDHEASPVLGFNVSGLIWNAPDGGRAQFGFVSDYRQAVLRVLTQALESSSCKVLLIPHVVTPSGHYESDVQACNEVVDTLAPAFGARVCAIPPPEGPREAKWFIAQCDWFCGTRMHATIAGLSSGVPTAAIAYSDKTLGVFETCGQGEHVHDPRKLSTEELVGRVVSSWIKRDDSARSLAEHLPRVLRIAERQMDDIAGFCDDSRVGPISRLGTSSPA